ncbi:MAG: metal dependent phosphohydrolase [Acidobacteriales bacterium]|nr:metal dependent phosphohydrolase [Terriglobales bacterium]
MNSVAIDIVRTLRKRRHQAYLAGGCVRDFVLGREPADYDVATDATPDEVMRIFPQTYAVGAQFGVVLVPYDDDRGSGTIEVATFRSDGAYSDGRHPDQVRYTKSPEEDVQRRDFTINGLLLDPLDGNNVLDYVGGRADLGAGIIRAIGDPLRRFTEDKLRVLRAVRFASRFGYTIEPQTFQAIRQLASQIHQVSKERVRDELTKMLTEGAARRAFELLEETGLLHEVLPEIEAMKGVEQPPQFHPEGDVWTHTLGLLEGLDADTSPTLAWGALLHDVGKPPTFRRAPDRIRFDNHADIGAKMAEAICRRMRMSNDDTEQIVAIISNHMKFPELPKMRESTLKRFLRQPKFNEHLAMHRLDCLASHRDLSLYEFAQEKLASTPPEQIRPEPLLTGHDLIAAGYPAGPRFKKILSEVEDAQLDGNLKSKDDALEFVLQRFGAPGCP